MSLLGGKTFAHGIHPPELKDETKDLPIRQFPFAPSLVIPLSQHIGKSAAALVREGQEVQRGQRIAKADGFLSVSMHAPASGVVRRIGLTPTISGRMSPGIFLEPFPGSTQEVCEGVPCDPATATPEEIVTAIQQAGIIGLGGAGFPTHAKLKIPEGKHADTLLINGAECEPFLTTDHRIMLEHTDYVMDGVRIVMKATGVKRAIVAVESNKPDCAEALRKAIPQGEPITVEVLPVKYPQGAEKLLISALLGREVPSGGFPLDVHALCVNVGTAAEIGMLLPHGAGLQERIITVGGPGVKKKGNYRVQIGTPLRFVLETVGVEPDVSRVFLGGPMMGFAASSLDIPVTKGTTGIIAFTEREMGGGGAPKRHPCIRCAHCLDACPMFLNPSMLGRLSEGRHFDRVVSEFNLMDCFECGCCTFVCPSHIPLVQLFRVAKSAVRKAKAKAT